MKKKGSYELRKEFNFLSAYCQGFLTIVHAHEANNKLGKIISVKLSFDSCKQTEGVFINEKQTNSNEYYLTGLSVFHEYGIQLVLSNKTYYSNIKPKIQDIIIHALAINQDIRTITYVIALMLKNKFKHDSLLQKKQKFNLPEEFIKNIIEFTETKGTKKPEAFPSWNEVLRV